MFSKHSNDVLINFEPLRKDIKNYLARTGLTHSFYFEYLFTGTNIRAGENNQLVGASLMKIPVVMDLYKAVEEGKINLDDTVTISKNMAPNLNENIEFGNVRKFKAGDQITLRELARIALAESDNTAAFTIFEKTKNLLAPEDQAINNLDVETRVGESNMGNYALIDARSYTTFLKCLYFSCFLSFDNSQEILNNLIHSVDDTRIRAGVPKTVEVVHKIGSFSNITQSDCGIVYVPNRRYTLCIMLDADGPTASRHIKKVSEMVYDYVTKVN